MTRRNAKTRAVNRQKLANSDRPGVALRAWLRKGCHALFLATVGVAGISTAGAAAEERFNIRSSVEPKQVNQASAEEAGATSGSRPKLAKTTVKVTAAP